MINYNYHECQVENVQLKRTSTRNSSCVRYQTYMISFKSLSESSSGASIAILIRHERLHYFMCCGGPHCLPVFPLTLLAAAPPLFKIRQVCPPPPFQISAYSPGVVIVLFFTVEVRLVQLLFVFLIPEQKCFHQKSTPTQP